jgi:hypothetical protein
MTLQDYINTNYQGNLTHFGNANGIKRQNVQKLLKAGFYYVYDGRLCMSKKTLVPVTPVQETTET